MRYYILLFGVLLSTLFIFTISVSAQEDRTNANLPVISDHIIWSMENATGWIKNKESQWLEGKNKIQRKAVSVSNKADWEQGINSVGLDNFIKFEVREMSFGGKEFLLFTKLMNDGYWKYKAIKTGWTPEIRIQYMVIRKGEGTFKISKDDATFMEINTTCYFRNMFAYSADYLDKIAIDIGKQNAEEPRFKEVGSTITLKIFFQELKDGKSCRFHITTGGDNNSIEWLLLPIDGYHILTSVMKDYYFEAPKEKLTSFIDMLVPADKKHKVKK
ncbi:hypothetical protein [Pedobacter nyackensis]|uniref:hypothetical protein n=1 Tax=Pedobacter nyackensis TaxID=475255 RepID=UPI00292E39A5|nr:hypothetical protein [Pedobacter nyackensis]